MDIGREVRVIEVSDLDDQFEVVPEPLPQERPVERPGVVSERAETD
ncbi:MAG TPA: hypothetical protein VI141_03095 [Acidimicrobiia bacterium]